MFGKNYWLTKCFVFTTNFEPIVKQSVANNTLLSQILVKKTSLFLCFGLIFSDREKSGFGLIFPDGGSMSLQNSLTYLPSHKALGLEGSTPKGLTTREVIGSLGFLTSSHFLNIPRDSHSCTVSSINASKSCYT